MKKSSLVLVAVLILAVGGLGVFALTKPRSSVMTNTDSTIATATPDPQVMNEPAMVGEGRYQVFSPDVLSSSASTRRVLFFYANWCPTCQPADRAFSQKSAAIPEDVTVIRVNYNDTETDQAEKDLAKQYGITYQHTFVQIDGEGNEVTKWNGGQLDELVANLK